MAQRLLWLGLALLLGCSHHDPKQADLERAFRLLDQVRAIQGQSEATQQKVRAILSDADRPGTLELVARLSWAAAWPQNAENVATDAPFDAAYHEAVHRLSGIRGPEAAEALSRLSLYVRPENGEREILDDAVARQKAR
jgi:hypothetical protein